jgi:hypothetical protein
MRRDFEQARVMIGFGVHAGIVAKSWREDQWRAIEGGSWKTCSIR